MGQDSLQEYSEQVSEIIQRGSWMQDFIASPHWPRFKAVILDVMDKEAYEGFVTEDPTDTEANRQWKIIGRIVRQIPDKMEKLIQQGKLALEQHTQEDIIDED